MSNWPLYPVDQAVTDASETQVGDCMSACVATIMGLPLSDVPVFVAETNWHGALCTFVEARGWFAVTISGLDKAWPWIPPDGLPMIFGGPSPRGPWNHAVVGCYSPTFTVLHDPHPSRAGLAGDVQNVTILVPPRAAWGAR